MSIIVGTDFSPFAIEASTAAAMLAIRLGETVRLIHVLEKQENEIMEKLENEAQRIRKLGAKVLDFTIYRNNVAEGVLQEVDLSTTLCIVGATKKEGKLSWFSGSTTKEIIKNSRVPVLVVKEAKPFTYWHHQERSLRIVVGSDKSLPAYDALHWVGRLCQKGVCDVIVTQVYDPLIENPRLGIPGIQNYLQGNPEVDQTITKELQKRVEELPLINNTRLRVHAHRGEAADMLVQVASEEKADLIVVGTHQREGIQKFLYGSTAEDIVKSSPLAVVCVPHRKEEKFPSQTLPLTQRVLVPTDFSPLGNQAIRHAYAAAGSGGLVHLLHVVTEPSHRPIKEEKALRDKLHTLVPWEERKLGIDTEVEVVANTDTSEAICQAAERMSADLICLSSHGHSGLSKWLKGSVAQDIMERTKKPVLIIQSENNEK